MSQPQPGWYSPEDPAYPAYYQGYPPPYYQPGPPTNGLAVGAMVVSLVSIFTCGLLIGPVGALMGHAARRQIRERHESGDGMALAGVIVGWCSFALYLLIIGFYVVLFVILGTSGAFDEPSY